MPHDKLPFKTYRARKRPWDRFRRSKFDQLGRREGVAPGDPDYPPPPPPPSRRQGLGPDGGARKQSPSPEVRQPAPHRHQGPPPPRRPDAPHRRRSGGTRRLPLLKIVKYFLIWVLAWTLLSALLFVVSATIQSGKISGETNAVLGGGGNFVTSPGTVLVLGLDKRPPGSKEPGAGDSPARSDSMMLLHTGGGQSQRLSILRDSYAAIPGYQAQKINAAYAYGGAALTIQTVEQFLGNGVDINHIVIIDFERFPQLIDALGGIDVKVRQRCVRSTFGGKTFRLRRGKHHLNGEQALRFARIRKNSCVPSEDDRMRAVRQQEVMSAMKSKAFSPFTFVRLPWVAWAAPKAILTDMSPVTLLAFISSVTFSDDPKTRVLKPYAPGPGNSLLISDEAKQSEVNRLLGR